ncbi:ABC transporter substrate-binding protein [Alcaligenaceae bacterium]|nr:ABC transporter substrate-binding protein [Alcaligenaceae bacterium]
MKLARRSLLKLGGTALALMALPYANIATANTPKRVTLVLRNEPPTLDPTSQPAVAVSELSLLNIFEGLTRSNEDGTIAPCLAESWTSSGAQEYIFKLRKGVVFQDGTPFTSADVKFTYERNASATSTNKRKRIFANIASINTPDDYTVIIQLKSPSRLFPAFMSEFTASIVSSKTADSNATHPVGTGPYRLSQWIKGSSVTLEKFDGHWNANNVTIDTVNIRFISDANAQVNAMLSGDVDVIPSFEALDLISQFQKDDRFVVTAGESTDVHLLCLNNKASKLSDVRVRKALMHAIDREMIIEGAVNGFATPIGSQMSPIYPVFIDLTGESAYDPDAARKLLAEAGYANGLDLNFVVPSTLIYQRAAEIIQAMFAQVGINAKIEVLEWAQWLDTVFRRKAYEISIVSQPDPWTIFNYLDPNYFYQYESEDFAKIMARAEQAETDQEFETAMHEAQRKLASDAPSGWLFSLSHVTVHSARISGVWKNAPNKINEMAAWRLKS